MPGYEGISAGVRGVLVPGYEGVLEPGYEGINVRGTRVLVLGNEGISARVRRY